MAVSKSSPLAIANKLRPLSGQLFVKNIRAADWGSATLCGRDFAKEKYPARIQGRLGHLVVKENPHFRGRLIGRENSLRSIPPNRIRKRFLIRKIFNLERSHQEIKVFCGGRGKAPKKNSPMLLREIKD